MYKITLIILSSLFVIGCGVTAPKYQPSYDNVKALKASNPKPVALEEVSPESKKIKSVSIRNNPLRSPHGDDLMDFIHFALESELSKAGALDANSNKKLTVLVKENEITAGAATANGKITAEFALLESDSILYRKNITAEDSWSSNFIGSIAIPRAAEAYPRLVEQLLGKLFADDDFSNAIGK